MTDPFVHDDMLEVVLRSRAGETAPPDLRTSILAAVAADGPRVVTRRGRATGHPWRLLAVAAVLLVGLGTTLFASGSRHGDDPQPSQPAEVPDVSASPTIEPSPSATEPQPSSGVTTVITTVPTGNCAELQTDAQQAGVTTGSWTVGKMGPANAVMNGLIATSGGVGSKEIRLVDPATGKSTLVPGFGGDGMSVIGWSPTGSALAFDAVLGAGSPHSCTGLFVRSSSGIVEVAAQRGGFGGPVWSPTGSALVYVAAGPAPVYDSHLYLAAADGSAPRDLGPVCGDCGVVDDPVWSPDEARIAVSWLTADQADSRLSVMDVKTNTWTVVPHSAGDRVAPGSLSRWLDASTLLIQADVMSPTGHQSYATIAVDKAGMPTTRVAWPPIDVGTISPDLKWVTNLGCISCTLKVTSRATGRTHESVGQHGQQLRVVTR